MEAQTIKEKDSTIKDQINALAEHLRIELRTARSVEEIRFIKEAERLWGEKVKEVIVIDGIKIVFESGSWILLRPSGTEPAVKLYVETGNKTQREKLLETGRRLIDISRNCVQKIIKVKSAHKENTEVRYISGVVVRGKINLRTRLAVEKAILEYSKGGVVKHYSDLSKYKKAVLEGYLNLYRRIREFLDREYVYLLDPVSGISRRAPPYYIWYKSQDKFAAVVICETNKNKFAIIPYYLIELLLSQKEVDLLQEIFFHIDKYFHGRGASSKDTCDGTSVGSEVYRQNFEELVSRVVSVVYKFNKKQRKILSRFHSLPQALALRKKEIMHYLQNRQDLAKDKKLVVFEVGHLNPDLDSLVSVIGLSLIHI